MYVSFLLPGIEKQAVLKVHNGGFAGTWRSPHCVLIPQKSFATGRSLLCIRYPVAFRLAARCIPFSRPLQCDGYPVAKQSAAGIDITMILS